MRIAIVALHFAEYAWRLSQALAARGDTVLLLMRAGNASAELDERELSAPTPVRTVLIPHRPLKDPRVIVSAFRIGRLLRGFRPDIVHIQETLHDDLLFALVWLRRLAPIVLTVHDHVTHSGRDSDLDLRRRLYRRYLRASADAVIIHAERISSEFQGLYPSLRGRVWSVPHGVLGPPAKTEPEAEPGNVLFFGRVEAYKGLGVLIEAISALQRDGVKVSLTIAGRGDDLARHRAAIGRMRGCRLIERFIPNAELPALFKTASVVALPYLDATQSGVAALAATYGRPVVASRTGGLPEMVRDGVSGILVEPGDATQLAGAIRLLVEDPDAASRLAIGARRLAQTDLAWDSIAERTSAVYGYARQLRTPGTAVAESTV